MDNIRKSSFWVAGNDGGSIHFDKHAAVRSPTRHMIAEEVKSLTFFTLRINLVSLELLETKIISFSNTKQNLPLN